MTNKFSHITILLAITRCVYTYTSYYWMYHMHSATFGSCSNYSTNMWKLCIWWERERERENKWKTLYAFNVLDIDSKMMREKRLRFSYFVSLLPKSWFIIAYNISENYGAQVNKYGHTFITKFSGACYGVYSRRSPSRFSQYSRLAGNAYVSK